MFMDSEVTRTFNYFRTIEAQLVEIKETSLSTTNMGDLSQVPVVTCLDVLAHPYPGTKAVFDLGRYQKSWLSCRKREEACLWPTFSLSVRCSCHRSCRYQATIQYLASRRYLPDHGRSQIAHRPPGLAVGAELDRPRGMITHQTLTAIQAGIARIWREQADDDQAGPASHILGKGPH